MVCYYLNENGLIDANNQSTGYFPNGFCLRRNWKYYGKLCPYKNSTDKCPVGD